MRFLQLVGVLSAVCVSIKALDVKVYKFPNEDANSVIPTIDVSDAIMNLVDQFDISSNYDLQDLSDIENIKIGQDKFFTEQDSQSSQEIILIVQGFIDNENYNTIDSKPIFKVKEDKKLTKFLLNLPNEFNNYYLNQLSNEIKLIQENKFENSKLNQIWDHYFTLSHMANNKLKSIWQDLKLAYHLSIDSSANDQSIELINDETFINEISQLKFLLENADFQSQKVIINLKSLTEILKKTGQDSKTYQNCCNILSNLINENLINNLNKNFKSTIILLPSITNENFQTIPTLNKRSEINITKSNCYLSEESCLVSTSSCSNHGVCAKSGDCWSCNCAASYNDTKKATTYWQGSDCSKKDVSVEFNLLMWFSIFMVVATTLGIKLMYDVGSQELPGVLGAATAMKKSNA